MSAGLTISRLGGFDDARLGREGWNALLRRGNSGVVFLTWEWQRAWWDSFSRSGLLLLLAEREGGAVALAPFFAEDDCIYFVGSGGSDYLDFIGDLSDGAVLDALLAAAWREAPSARAMVLYHVRDDSRTGPALHAAGARLGREIREEPGMGAPALVLDSEPGRAAAQKKSLRRHERFFEREGKLEISHLQKAAEVLPRLELFFAQHIDRWSGTESPSLFHSEAQKQFYRELTTRGAEAGWLRFTEVRWNDQPIAFHFGTSYAGSYLWYKPSFDIALARHSPGEVLLRQLLLAALEEGAEVFDFGLGEEPFKMRFASQMTRVKNYTLLRQ